MRHHLWLSTLALLPAPALAQADSMPEILRRLDAVERENASLRQEVARLSARSAAAPSAPAVAPAPLPATPPVSASPVVAAEPRDGERWAGGYIGPQAGISRMRFTTPYRDPANPEQSVTSSDPAIGAQLGYRWQEDGLVAGFAFDLSVPYKSKERLRLGPNLGAMVPNVAPLMSKLDVRAGGQLGFATGPLLVYGTGGLGVSRIRYGIPTGGLGRFDYRTINQPGLFYGAGAALALPDGLSLELEATEADLGLIVNNPKIYARDRSLMLRLNKVLR